MKRNTLLQRDATERLEVKTSVVASKCGVKASDGIFMLTAKADGNPEAYAGSAVEGIRFFAGLVYGSAIAIGLWLTIGGVAWWVTR